MSYKDEEMQATLGDGDDDELTEADLGDDRAKPYKGLVSSQTQTRHLPFCKRFAKSPAMIGLAVVVAAALIAGIVAIVEATRRRGNSDPPSLSPATPEAPPITHPTRVQLPRTIRPTNYRIALTPSFTVRLLIIFPLPPEPPLFFSDFLS